MTTYVKASASDTWHWCRNCSKYPTGPGTVKESTTKRPAEGELCNECKAKEKAGNCRS